MDKAHHWKIPCPASIYQQVFPSNGALTGKAGKGARKVSAEVPTSQPIGGALLHLAMNAEPAWERELNSWLNEELLPGLLALPGFISARRFSQAPTRGGVDAKEMARDKANEGKHKYLTVIEMRDVSVLQSPGYLAARKNPTPRAQKLALHYTYLRSVYHQIFPAKGSFEEHGGITKDAFVEKAGWKAPPPGGI